MSQCHVKPPIYFAPALTYMREHFANPLYLSELASTCCVSDFAFCREFHRTFGRTPMQMLLAIRVHRAKRLLRKGVPLAHVAGACGYSHQSNFCYWFKRMTGTTPGRWRRQFREHEHGDTFTGNPLT